jgi:hypothetical protein
MIDGLIASRANVIACGRRRRIQLERGVDCGIFASGAANFWRREIVLRSGVRET